MRFLFFLLYTCFNFNVAFALNWDEGLKELSQQNPELFAAKSLLQSSYYQEKVAKSGFLPQINATAETSYGTTDTNLEASKSNNLSLVAIENIFSGFSDTAKLNQAQHTREGNEANLVAVKAKVSYEYKTSFMNLLYAQKYILLAADIIKRREANLKLVQLRFESGRENLGSLHLARAYLVQAKYDHLVATNGLGLAQTQLGKVLGRDDGDNLQVTGEVPITDPNIVNFNFKELITFTPDYQKAVSEEKGALSSLDLAKSTFYPSLNLSQSASRSNSAQGAWKNGWAIGAELSFPLFSGGKDYYSYKSSTELYRRASLTKKNIQDTGLVKLKDAYTKYVESVFKLEVDRAFVEAANARERIAKEKYNNGLLTFDEWDIIENDLISRQKTLVQTERERVNAEALWEQVQGKGVL